MKPVYIQIIAFDKHSNQNFGKSIIANTKESFNKQVEEFENNVPFTKFYTELISDDILDEEQQKIIEDHEVN